MNVIDAATPMREAASDRTFFGIATALFVASAAATIAWCASMSKMHEMPMPGGWSMSMTWMRMPGQSWLGLAASFLGMWIVMMVAMMLPSLAPCCGAVAERFALPVPYAWVG
jgi:predicted metal-binding membrane protein